MDSYSGTRLNMLRARQDGCLRRCSVACTVGIFPSRIMWILHGLNLTAAKTHFDRFLERAIAAGKRAVLVVHGRGRCSPGPPVLKQNLTRWLVSGRWKRWVIAFTSARSHDGGTGATYVLLRRRPR